MKYLFFFIGVLFSITIYSCEKRMIAGKYIYRGNHSFFEIDKENNYYFTTIGDVHQTQMFSRGKIKLNKREVTFIPDSSYFFRISVLKHYFDPSLKKNREIILVCPDSVLAKFHFTFHNGTPDSNIDFKNKGFVIYTPVFQSYQDGSIILKAQLRDTVVVVPKLLHEFVLSNTIHFFDVNNDDPKDSPWNVVELGININRDMFAFTTVSPYIFKDKRLIKKEWPVYELSRE
jgi:hypothetical protein